MPTWPARDAALRTCPPWRALPSPRGCAARAAHPLAGPAGASSSLAGGSRGRMWAGGSCIKKIAISEPLVDTVNPEQICTKPCQVRARWTRRGAGGGVADLDMSKSGVVVVVVVVGSGLVFWAQSKVPRFDTDGHRCVPLHARASWDVTSGRDLVTWLQVKNVDIMTVKKEDLAFTVRHQPPHTSRPLAALDHVPRHAFLGPASPRRILTVEPPPPPSGSPPFACSGYATAAAGSPLRMRLHTAVRMSLLLPKGQ